MDQEEKTETENKNKIFSRKFIVWICSTLFMIFAFVISFCTKENEVALSFIPIWGGISMLYIGGNVAQDWIFNRK